MGILSDPGGIVYALIAAVVIVCLFLLITKASDEQNEDEFAPKPPLDPEADARRRPF